MRLRHLALSVSDVERLFYMDKIGLRGSVTVEDWGVRLGVLDRLVEAQLLVD